jgi:tryptophan synthase alpha chain
MSSINKVFESLRLKGEGALIGYVMCGDPHPKYTLTIAEALIKGGVDILEFGLPFSDPIADGPTIQAASVRALNAGTTPKVVFRMTKAIKQKYELPIVVMTYFNPVFKMGLESFFDLSRCNEVDGVIVPDLPVEEADEYRVVAEASGVDTVFIVAPSTTNERLAKIASFSRGFLYIVSHFGVTGARTSVEDSTISLINRVKLQTRARVPLAVGFGVSEPEHVKRILQAGAEGVIVGSAFVNVVSKNQGNVESGLNELTRVARRLKEATLK